MSMTKPRKFFLHTPDLHLFQLEGEGRTAFWYCRSHDEEMEADPEDGWPIDCMTCERAAGFMCNEDGTRHAV